MILNSQIWQMTISEAKAMSYNNAALLRAIDRAVIEIERSAYWTFIQDVLRIKSTTSAKLYVIDEAHKCEAHDNGHKFCKHSVARRLMMRYTQNLGIAAAQNKPKRQRQRPAVETHRVVEVYS